MFHITAFFKYMIDAAYVHLGKKKFFGMNIACHMRLSVPFSCKNINFFAMLNVYLLGILDPPQVEQHTEFL